MCLKQGRSSLIFLILSLVSGPTLAATKLTRSIETIHVRPTLYSFSYEVIKSTNPDSFYAPEDLGLAGPRLSFMFGSGLLLGVGGYAAAAGKRAGFLIVGASVGYRYRLTENLIVVPDVFVGAGGGEKVPVGQGIMARPSLALGLDFGSLALLFGWAYLRFPTGKVESNQPFLELAFASDFSYLTSHDPDERLSGTLFNIKEWKWAMWRLVPSARCLYTWNKQNKLGLRHRDVSYLGAVTVDYFFRQHFFTSFEFQNAVGNSIPGFVGGTFGLGLSIPVVRSIRAESKLGLGFAGGGDVNTGPGGIVDPSVGLFVSVYEGYGFHLHGGYLYAIDGPFRVPYVGAGLTAGLVSLEPRERARTERTVVNANVPRQRWRFSLSTQRWLLHGRGTSSTGQRLANTDLLGLNLDYFPIEFFFVGVGTYWPYSGGFSGLGNVMFGLGVWPRVEGRLKAGLKLSVGGIPGESPHGGSGGVVQGLAEVGFEAAENVVVFAGGGALRYFRGTYAYLAEAGFRYSFSLPAALSLGKTAPERTAQMSGSRERTGEEVERSALERAAQYRDRVNVRPSRDDSP